ncbi:MAG: helix-turn-helix domain-containing protein [Butyrivibrio sp.]|nr:helix-turn-helix domain-containing protein [Butyrivibrio sp.]
MSNLDLLADSLEYIEEHLRDNIRTDDIAAVCHCSRSTLEKLFLYVNSISVHDYIVRRRMMLAARQINGNPNESILDVALEYGYNSNEAFTRAFRKVWYCNPSEFRKRKFVELFPRIGRPIGEYPSKKGDLYFMSRRNVDISELYDFFVERRNCCFVCCDISHMMEINEISRKAGDLGIIETMKRMQEASGEEDVVFRIGGDEFCILTNSEDEEYAKALADKICGHNGEAYVCDGRDVPLTLWAVVTKFNGSLVRYNDLFVELHTAIENGKN